VSLRTKVEPIDRDIALMLGEELSPQGQSAVFAKFAAEQINEASQINRQILGREPIKHVFVDGREGAPLSSVKPDGIIVAEYDLFSDTLAWIGQQLEQNSPVGKPPKGKHPGLYRRSHTLFADGLEVEIGTAVPLAQEYVFINTLPYARKIEMGQSSQAPDGVFQAVAVLARKRFGNVARVSFSYRAALSGSILRGRAGNRSEGRYPAIVVRLFR
jgi:hypothetical protein